MMLAILFLRSFYFLQSNFVAVIRLILTIFVNFNFQFVLGVLAFSESCKLSVLSWGFGYPHDVW